MGRLAINDRYLSFLFKLDNRSKKPVINKLSESIERSEKSKKFETKINFLYGTWEDNRTSEDILEDIKESRIEKKKKNKTVKTIFSVRQLTEVKKS